MPQWGYHRRHRSGRGIGFSRFVVISRGGTAGGGAIVSGSGTAENNSLNSMTIWLASFHSARPRKICVAKKSVEMAVISVPDE